MKKLLLCLMIVLLLPVAAISETTTPTVFTFRNGVMFGMSQDEVIQCEGDNIYEEYMEADLLYRTQETPEGEADIHYCFEGGEELVAIIVEYTAEYETQDDALAAFQAIDTSLTATYGEPYEREDYTWYNDTSFALDTAWDTELVSIYHSVLGDDSSFDRDKLYIEPPSDY